MRTLRVLIAIGVGVALADASIVTLALPELLIDLDTGVEGVAAVIGVYTFALAVALPLAALARRAVSDPVLGAIGFAVFAVAGGFCAAADTLTSMLVFRTLQALGAAAAQNPPATAKIANPTPPSTGSDTAWRASAASGRASASASV